jgi:hypothetical protein
LGLWLIVAKVLPVLRKAWQVLMDIASPPDRIISTGAGLATSLNEE